MANLDVALRLRLINGLKGPSQDAKRDLDSLRTSAQRLNATRGGDGLARDLNRVVTAGSRADASLRQLAANRGGLSATGAVAARLDADLTGVATAGGRVDAALRRVVGSGAGLSTIGAGAARLGSSLTGVATAGGQADVSLRRLGSERAAIAGLDAVTKALAQDLDRTGSAAKRTATGLGRIGSERARIAGTAAVAAELARNLERAASVAPRIRLPQAPNTSPWGERPSGPAPRRPADQPSPRPTRPMPPDDDRRVRSGSGEGEGALVALGRRALPAIGGIYAVRGAIRGTVGEAISFEKAWAEVIKKVNDAPNPAAMQQLQRTVAKTAIELGLPRQGLAELTAEAGAAGIKFVDLERYVRLAAKASVGWDMTPRDAAQKLAEIKSAGQFTIAEMDTLADKINALGDNSAAKEADIVEMIQRAAAPAKTAGVSMDTTLAAVTALRSGGMQAEVASRFFGAFSSELATIDADGAGKKAKKVAGAFDMLGLSARKVKEGMRVDAAGTMIDILDRLSKHAEPAKVAKEIMGGEWWDELARFGQSLPEFRKQLDFLRNPANFSGSLGTNLNVQLSTTANHLARLKALSEDVGDRMGRWALPGINSKIDGVIKLMDELDRRKALRDAIDDPTGQGDQTGRFVTATTKAVGEGAEWLKNKALDAAIAPLPTDDPSRAAARARLQNAADASKAAEKAREEADSLEARARTTKDKTISGPLINQARQARESAVSHDAAATEATRSAGPRSSRDMTDVEFGETAARQSIETMRRLRGIEAGLAAGKQRNIRLPGTGVVMSRESAQAELIELRERMRSMTAGPDKVTTVRPPKFDLSGPSGQADMRIGRQPGAATSFPSGPDFSQVKFDAQPVVTAVKQAEDAAKGLQTTLKQDLSGPATESMQTYQTALSAGVQSAIAIVVAAAAQMKAALSFNASPTITPSLSAPRAAPAGGAPSPATASPARATGSGGATAPRVQSAALRRPGGGNTFNGPIHVHGVTDVASLQRGISREADRKARDARDNGLHDLGSYA